MNAALTPADDPLPIGIIGVLQRADGPDRFWFQVADGSTVAMDFELLAQRQSLVGLFGGEAWLRRHFPGQFTVVPNRDGGGRTVATGINAVEAARHLAQLCIDAEQATLEAPPAARRSWLERMAELMHAAFSGWGMML